MKIIGIDTILHDVCAAVVEDGRFVLSNVVEHTIMDSGRLYQLVDLHLNQIGLVIKKAMQKAKCRPEEISLVSVNNFGSFFSNTLIGATAAETLSKTFNKPLITVHHQEAHYFSSWLERDPKDFSFPILVLSSSGGHSSIVKILNNKFGFRELYRIEGMEERKKNKPNFRGIGAVYGYVADALKIGGPIGSAPVISEYATKGNKTLFDFYKRIGHFDITKLDFSPMEKIVKQVISRELKKRYGFSHQFISDFAASFENSMAQLISDGLIKLAAKEKVQEIHLVGGISANNTLRKMIGEKCVVASLEFKCPKQKSFCTDNAAMIASWGYFKYRRLSKTQKERLTRGGITIDSNLRLEEMALNQRRNKNV